MLNYSRKSWKLRGPWVRFVVSRLKSGVDEISETGVESEKITRSPLTEKDTAASINQMNPGWPYWGKKSSPMKKTVFLSLLAIVPAFPQTPKFELADVHVSATAHGFAQNFGGVLRGGRYVNRDATMLQLIEAAYGVSEDTIAGGPGWLNSDLFDVVAKVPEGTTAATANLMLQALLAERFALDIKNETHGVPRFVLTVGKGGSKLKPAGGSGETGCKSPQQGGPPPNP